MAWARARSTNAKNTCTPTSQSHSLPMYSSNVESASADKALAKKFENMYIESHTKVAMLEAQVEMALAKAAYKEAQWQHGKAIIALRDAKISELRHDGVQDLFIY